VLGRVKDRSVAEDLVSEIFLEAWRQAHRFEARAAVSTWLLAIARHKAMSMQRRLKTHYELDAALAIEDRQIASDAARIERIAAGDKVAMQVLFVRHLPGLLCISVRARSLRQLHPEFSGR
jgi:DNA-directed RNA polymerase specialized sigma24 family protein